MSMVNHTLRAVKITKNIFELRKINRDIKLIKPLNFEFRAHPPAKHNGVQRPPQ